MSSIDFINLVPGDQIVLADEHLAHHLEPLVFFVEVLLDLLLSLKAWLDC